MFWLMMFGLNITRCASHLIRRHTFNVDNAHHLLGSANSNLAMTAPTALLPAWLDVLEDTFPWSSHQHPTLTHNGKSDRTWPSPLWDCRKHFGFKCGLSIAQFKRLLLESQMPSKTVSICQFNTSDSMVQQIECTRVLVSLTFLCKVSRLI